MAPTFRHGVVSASYRYRALQSLEHQVTTKKIGRPDASPDVTHVPISARRPPHHQQVQTRSRARRDKMHPMMEHESFDGDRYDDMPDTVDELLTAAAEDEVEAVTMHELGRCHELEGPCMYCAGQVPH